MEGNCLYQDQSNFKYHLNNKENLRYNIFTLCKNRQSILEIGFNGGHSVALYIFSNPNMPGLWAPFGLPSLWVWQLFFLGYGIFVMWFLAFHMGLSDPIDPEKVKALAREND